MKPRVICSKVALMLMLAVMVSIGAMTGWGQTATTGALTGTTTPATLSSAATNNLNGRDHAFMSFSPRSAGSPELPAQNGSAKSVAPGRRPGQGTAINCESESGSECVSAMR